MITDGYVTIRIYEIEGLNTFTLYTQETVEFDNVQPGESREFEIPTDI